MAKSHFSSKKRLKEMERKQKQERKRERKFNKDPIEPELAQDPVEDKDQAPQPR